MAKKDTIKYIVDTYADRGYDAESLDKDYNATQLEDLRKELDAEAAKNKPTVPEEPTVEDETVTEDEDIETTPSTAEIVKSKATYKLANPKTQYADHNFSLAGKQEKELPDIKSEGLIARIKSGFIVKVD
jgi:hypothetical protein